VRSVEVLDAIIRDAESMSGVPADSTAPPMGIDYVKALSEAAVSLSRRSNAHAIVAITREGKTAKLLSAIRPHAVIVAATDKPEVARVLALWHGVVPIVCDLEGETEQVITRVVESAVKRSAAPDSAIMVVVNTTTDLDRGSSNFVRIRRA
jgi:pyruvate kinase